MELLSAPTLAARSGELYKSCNRGHLGAKIISRVTAIADKLGIEFALTHRQRANKNVNSQEERMDVLVGDVRDKVTSASIWYLGCLTE